MRRALQYKPIERRKKVGELVGEVERLVGKGLFAAAKLSGLFGLVGHVHIPQLIHVSVVHQPPAIRADDTHCTKQDRRDVKKISGKDTQ